MTATAPHSFADANGRRWRVRLTAGDFRAARTRLGYDLGDAIDKAVSGAGGTLADPAGAVDLLFLLCEPADGRPTLDDEAFGRSLDGPAFEAADAALWRAVADFFPSRRALILAIQAKAAEVEAAQTAAAIRQVEAVKTPAPSEPASNSAGGSDSTPGASPSAS